MDEQMLDKILSAVLDNQAKLCEHDQLFQDLKGAHERTYNRIDGFLVIIDRHEAEIAALRSAYGRLEERLEAIEKQLAAV